MLFKLKNKYYFFIFAFILFKIVLMALFSSDYQNRLFMPFINTFLDNISGNPYDYFYYNNIEQSFPYPPLMLFIMSLGGLLIRLCHFIGFDIQILNNMLFKLPILFFDLLGLIILLKFFPSRRKYIAILYFASPIILYSSFMHGQLDVIPTSLALAALYYLVGTNKKALMYFTLLCSAAILTKQHILMLVPLALIYIDIRYSFKQAVLVCIGIVVISSCVMYLYMGEGFFYTVLFNREMSLLTQTFFPFVDLKVYLPILAIFLVYINYYMCNSTNKDLFISFCGVLFAVSLIFVSPMPGWYVWIVPFITIFFVQISNNKYRNIGVFIGLNCLYLIYFVFCHKSNHTDLYFLNTSLDVFKINNQFVASLIFTMLEVFLIYATVTMYRLGIASNSFYKRKNMPFAIGISGDSGSGKTTLLQHLRDILGNNRIVQIEGDGDHKWERNEKIWEQYTHLNPKANHLYRQAMDIERLRNGASVMRVEYDHNTGKFTEQTKVSPKPYIVISSLHSLYLPNMRKQLDFKIFMDTSQKLCTFWKMKRDISKRSYSLEKIREQIDRRVPDAEKYITPQMQYADLVISYYDPNIPDDYNTNYEVSLHLKITLSTEIYLEPLVEHLAKYGIHSDFEFSDDLEKQIINIAPRNSRDVKIPFNDLAYKLIPFLDDITTQEISNDDDDFSGIIKIIILDIISHKLKNNASEG